VQELQLPLVLPVAILTAWALLVLLIAPFFRETPRGWAGLISPWGVSLLGVGFAFAACCKQWTGITALGRAPLTAWSTSIASAYSWACSSWRSDF
jgi:hypothetical protein